MYNSAIVIPFLLEIPSAETLHLFPCNHKENVPTCSYKQFEAGNKLSQRAQAAVGAVASVEKCY